MGTLILPDRLDLAGLVRATAAAAAAPVFSSSSKSSQGKGSVREGEREGGARLPPYPVVRWSSAARREEQRVQRAAKRSLKIFGGPRGRLRKMSWSVGKSASASAAKAGSPAVRPAAAPPVKPATAASPTARSPKAGPPPVKPANGWWLSHWIIAARCKWPGTTAMGRIEPGTA